MDAAVAATLCVGTVSMFSSGIGGGGFLTVRVPGDGVYTIDFRETAPEAANKTMFGTYGGTMSSRGCSQASRKGSAQFPLGWFVSRRPW